MALTSKDHELLAKMKDLTRNTRVLVRGNLLDNPAPIYHIDASEVTVLAPFAIDPRAHKQVPAPEALQALAQGGDGRLIGTVHFVGRTSPFLVIDYKDHVLPLFIPPLPKDSPLLPLFQTLNRFDEVAIHYKPMKQISDEQPLHLILDVKAKQPIEVLQAISSLHQTTATIKGWLVRYPINPVIGTTHVTYGVRVEGDAGVARDVFLVSQDEDEYKAMLALMDQKWDEAGWSEVYFTRNRYVNHKITVDVTGAINVEAPNQANPQLLCSKKAIHFH